MDIQEEYHSDEESQKKKIDAAREKEKQAEEEAVRRRNLFVKGALFDRLWLRQWRSYCATAEVKTEKVEKTDEEFLRLERRLAELEAEEARVEHGGSQSTADVAASGKAEEEDDDDGEDEDGDEDEGDAFDEFYTTGDDDESVSDDGEGEEEPAEISDEGEEEDEDEEEDTRANKQLKSVHLRTHTPPHPSKRPLKPASVPSNSPAATKGAGAAVVKVAEAEATEPIEKPRVSFSTQTLPAYVRPPVPPGKLKPCLAPPRPITVAAPPPKEVRWTHSTDADLPRYKARPPPQPQPVVTGNRSRSSARGPPPPSIQALQAAASVTAAAAAAEPARNVAVGEVMERAAPAAALPVATTEAQSAPAEAPRKVSRYRAMMEQRQGN